MAVQLFRGNIFESGAELIACFTNGDGMPFGFGGEVLKRNPQAFKNHLDECLGDPKPKGSTALYKDQDTIAYVVVADNSLELITPSAIAEGLKSLHAKVRHFSYNSIAVKAQLDRDVDADTVRRLVCEEFDDSEIMVILYRPLPDKDCQLSELEQQFIDAMVTVTQDLDYSERVGIIPAGAVGYIANYGKETGVPIVDFGGVRVMLKWDEFLVHRQMDRTIVKRGNPIQTAALSR